LNKVFPKEVFEDIKSSDFKKYNKKGVSEDFVTENFKAIGWKCFRPFEDTGVDLVVRKEVCPDNHTRWNKEEEEKQCSTCEKKLITITRFIQIKTREEKKGIVGYTLDTADIRSDPRHIILIYSDKTLDFLILPIFEYLKFFTDNTEAGEGHFGTPSFRYENNKVNNLKYSENEKEFSWAYFRNEDKFVKDEKTGKKKKLPRKVKKMWTPYLNENGMEKLSNPDADNDLVDKIKKIAEMKLKLIHSYRSGKEIHSSDTKAVIEKVKKDLTTLDKKKIKGYEKGVKDILKKKTSKTATEIMTMRKKNYKKVWNKIKNDEELVESLKKSWERFKELNIEYKS